MAHCRVCQQRYYKGFYTANKAREVARARKNNLKIGSELKDRIAALRSVPCADCGGSFHPWQMEFDHLPQFVKVSCVTSIASSAAKHKFEAEVAKCEVVCANCHRHRTHIRKLSAGVAE